MEEKKPIDEEKKDKIETQPGGGASKLVLIPVKQEELENARHKVYHPNLPDINGGALMGIIGAVKSGKSVMWNNLLMNENHFKDFFSDVYIISPTIANDSTSRFAYKRWKNSCWTIYDDGIIDAIAKRQKQKMERADIDSKVDSSYCLVMDDCVGQISKFGRKGGAATSFCTRFRHYVKRGDPCLIIYSTQKFFECSTILRANFTDICISGTIRSSKEMKSIVEAYADVYGGEQKFLEMFSKVKNVPYAWLYLKLHTTPAEAYMNFTHRLV